MSGIYRSAFLSQDTSSTLLDYSSGALDSSEPEKIYYGLTATTWFKIVTITILMVWLFYMPNLRRLWLKTNPFTGEANWGHSVCVPIIGLYYLYANREELLKAPVKTAWSGLFIMLGGLFLFAYGIYPGQNDFVKDFGMVVTLFGIVVLQAGWSVMKIVWFPIVFLVCAIPWPGLVYSWIAGPLQALAARVAVFTLSYTGVMAYNSGTKIFIGGANGQMRTLNVAEACAGLRSLMTFISVGATIAFLSNRPFWQKILITLSAIPIAIFCNVMRVAGQGLLDHYVSPDLSQSFAHQFVGLLMLVPAFFLILLIGWSLDRLFIEVVEEKHKLAISAVESPQIVVRGAAQSDASRTSDVPKSIPLPPPPVRSLRSGARRHNSIQMPHRRPPTVGPTPIQLDNPTSIDNESVETESDSPSQETP